MNKWFLIVCNLSFSFLQSVKQLSMRSLSADKLQTTASMCFYKLLMVLWAQPLQEWMTEQAENLPELNEGRRRLIHLSLDAVCVQFQLHYWTNLPLVSQ